MYDEKAVNRHIRNLDQSPTFAINDECRRLLAEGKQVFNLGLGQSPFEIPDHVVRALRDHASDRLYRPSQGTAELRQAVADFHRCSDSLVFDPENIIIGPGSKLLLFLLQLTFDGDIIIPTPSWVTYVPQARIIGHRIRLIHTTFKNRWHVQPGQITGLIKRIKGKVRPRLLILNSPGNPCGLAYCAEELKAIADVCREHEIIVLSDEIYGHLHHGENHVSIARFFPEGTIVSSGLSKWCAAGGWRLGTFAFPQQLQWLMKPMVVAASETYSAVCAPIQPAAVAAFTLNDDMLRYLMNVRRILRILGNECAGILQDAGIDVHTPEAGFYLFPDFTRAARKRRWRIDGSERLATRLLEEAGVAVLPGRAFNRPKKELTARLAYVNFDGKTAMEAAWNIPEVVLLPKDFARTHCADTLKAMELIAQWVS